MTQAREQAEYTTGAFLAVVNNDAAKVRVDRSSHALTQCTDTTSPTTQIEEYLDYGVLPHEARDDKGNTLLHKAVQQGNKVGLN